MLAKLAAVVGGGLSVLTLASAPAMSVPAGSAGAAAVAAVPRPGAAPSAPIAFTPSAPSVASCNQGRVCAWQRDDFTGSVFNSKQLTEPPNAVADFKQEAFNNGDQLNDKISSVFNNSNLCWELFIRVNFENAPTTSGDKTSILVAPQGSAVFHKGGSDVLSKFYNDKLSSALTYATTGSKCPNKKDGDLGPIGFGQVRAY